MKTAETIITLLIMPLLVGVIVLGVFVFAWLVTKGAGFAVTALAAALLIAAIAVTVKFAQSFIAFYRTR